MIEKCTISFDGFNSERDLGLTLIKRDIGSPDAQTAYIEIPGRSGLLDVSEAIAGYPTYGKRKLKFQFFYAGEDQETVRSAVFDTLHGRRKEISVDGIPGYFTGRVSVEADDDIPGYMTFDVTADCDPYRLDDAETVVKKAISGSGVLTCKVSGMPVEPTVTLSADMALSTQGKTFNLKAGTRDLGVVWVPGSYDVTVTGTGDVSIKWRGGQL